MILAGIDYSLTGPAICVFEGDVFCYDNCTFYFLTDVKKHTELIYPNIFAERFIDWNQEMERYKSIADWAIEILIGVDAIALEGYAYGATGRVFSLAENTGVLKYKIYELGKPLTIFTPSEVKKHFSGKGNADKNAMHDAFIKKTAVDLRAVISPNKMDITSPVSDLVDSYAICRMLHEQMVLSQY